MKDLTRWWFAHALHWAVLYGAFAADMDGAMYVLKFWVWVMAPLSLFLLNTQAGLLALHPKTLRLLTTQAGCWHCLRWRCLC